MVYALGMASVVGVLALLAATASAQVARIRRATPVITRVSGVLMVLAGLYVTWYGIYELRLLNGGAVGDPVVDAALRVQGSLVRLVDGVGAGGIAVLTAALAVVVVAATTVLRRRRVRA